MRASDGDKPLRPYAMQMTSAEIHRAGAEVSIAQVFDGRMVPSVRRQFVTDLGLWIAADEVTVLDLAAEGWQVLETSVPLTMRGRLDARLGDLRARWIRWQRRVRGVGR